MFILDIPWPTLFFCRESPNVQRKKKGITGYCNPDREDLVEDVMKNEDSKDIEKFCFLLSHLD